MFSFILVMFCCIHGAFSTNVTNHTSAKDLYVIRATVYQVGLLTNKTKAPDVNKTGTEETLTLYRQRGSDLKLGSVPPPVLANVTLEHVLGVTPTNITKDLPRISNISGFNVKELGLGKNTAMPWTILNQARLDNSSSAHYTKREIGNQSIIQSPPIWIPSLRNTTVISYSKTSTLLGQPQVLNSNQKSLRNTVH